MLAVELRSAWLALQSRGLVVEIQVMLPISISMLKGLPKEG